MAQPYDMPLEELKAYKPQLTKQLDFDDFWQETLDELSSVPFTFELTAYNYPVKGVKVYQISFLGYHHATIGGYYVVPDSAGSHPGLVLYHGYNWALDGNLHEAVNWSLHGYVVLQMHVRGQYGSSVDNMIPSTGHTKGWMTKGILSPKEYYYRAVYMDSVRAVEILSHMKEVDSSRIGLGGGSQGGALTLAAAALSSIPQVVVSDFPYLSHIERAIDIAPAGPYHELNEYFMRNHRPEIEEQSRITLSYIDVMNLASRIKCHVLITVGLVDQITPPSTIFATYNHLTCSKDIVIARYFGHEYIPLAVEPKLRTLMHYLQR
jgi:cephalosporin-C deacetylase